jgi:sugar lactone lactonase YvrE
MYFADSPTHVIQVFDLLEPEGVLSAPRAFARTPAGAYPDGAAVDADGCVWSAHWGSGTVVRYTPGGVVDRTLHLPTTQPSCVCFGGPDLDVLCVTTARRGLSSAALSAQPNAGDVFLYRVGVKGLAECEFQP